MRKVIHPSTLSFVIVLITLSFTAIGQQQQRISQFERAGLCDLLIDKSGIYHAVFQESPANGKPVFIYYSNSANKGATWSKPITLSNDNTGNGAGYPRILQDGAGRIYAIWKRYGHSGSNYPVSDEILDGPGGYSLGTIFYKVLSGGTWSNQVQLNESEQSQVSWFATVTPSGDVRVFWTQGSFESIKNKTLYWYYADFMRTVSLNGTSFSEYTNLSTPSKPSYAGGYPAEKRGGLNLQGYVDKAGMPHLIYEDAPEDVQQIKYYDGKTQRIVYKYPKYKQGNTFHNPAKLLVDEKGNDHLVFVPSSATLESEQVWDINLATNETKVLTAIEQSGVRISGFQAAQGPNGAMAVTIQVYKGTGNTEAYGMFFSNGTWKNIALTNNAAKEKFFSKDFVGLGGYKTNISTLTTYNSTFISVAYDAAGKKSLLMTLSARWSAGGYSTSNPSIVFIPIDR
jgi:hypothetical protein